MKHPSGPEANKIPIFKKKNYFVFQLSNGKNVDNVLGKSVYIFRLNNINKQQNK